MMWPAMYKYLLFAILPLLAQMPPADFGETNKKIAVQNGILAKVNETTISMLDVKKRMDLFFHQHYSNLSHSNGARYQFYEKSWRPVLMEMIDNELIIADAIEKEVKVADSEIRETMENRFGPNVLSTLDLIGLTYDEAWKLLRNELIVQRMSWWFVQSKAIESVTPQSIRQAYRSYLEEHPAHKDLEYRIVSVRGEDLETLAGKVHQILSTTDKSPELLELDTAAQVSAQYSATDLEISESHRAALAELEAGQYSQPILQKSRADNKEIARIFYLVSKTDHPAPPFQELSSTLRNELTQKAMAQHSLNYVQKLRKHYGFDSGYLNEALPLDMHPFSLQ
jgi:hypothetical protein